MVAKFAVAPYRFEEAEEERLQAAVTMTHKCLVKLGQITAAASEHKVRVQQGEACVTQKLKDSEAIAVEGGAVRARPRVEEAKGKGGQTGKVAEGAQGAGGAA